MQDQNEWIFAPLDLNHYTEATRRELYERLVRIQHASPEPPSPSKGEAAGQEEKEEEPVSEFDPERAELMVFHAFGRWFATWVDREAPENAPEHLRRELVRIQAAPEHPEGILLFEV